MSLQDSFNSAMKYNGKTHVGVNDIDRGQCTGLFEQVIADLGLGFVPGNAKDLFANAPADRFQKVTNNPNDANQLPPPGSWFVFGPQPWNFYLGHVGMIVSSTPNSFVGLEQNNPAGDNLVKQCTHAGHLPYAGLIGWLIPGTAHPIVTASEQHPVGGWATVKSTANVRAQANTTSAITSVLTPGARFQYDNLVQGQNVSGNSTWVKSHLGHFVWSGNVIY